MGSVRVTQTEIQSLGLDEIRMIGMRLFNTSFNKLDGFGDGPSSLVDPLSMGGRPTLQGNGTLLRVNGLDAQSCLECHSVVSAATSPPTFGVGGVGGAVTNAIIVPSTIDPADLDFDGEAGFNGRFANPPFVFGAGGVELLAAEMTQDLQALKADALANPGTTVVLESKGVNFGTIVATGGTVDTSGVEGVGDDLVVRPFGRKGQFATTREFSVGAMQFHFGMQPNELVGAGVDHDGDGVVNELLDGELSALSVFLSTVDRPFTQPLSASAQVGAQLFDQIGCASCHTPELTTRGKLLPVRHPEDPTDPVANVYRWLDLSQAPPAFEEDGSGGLRVPLFSDLKRHDTGAGLAEDFALAGIPNEEFVTARLWGIADTAPYLHDGRALILTDAILLHGGEAQAASSAFDALPDSDRETLLEFLRSLRTPLSPVADLLGGDDDEDDDDDDGDDGDEDSVLTLLGEEGNGPVQLDYLPGGGHSSGDSGSGRSDRPRPRR